MAGDPIKGQIRDLLVEIRDDMRAIRQDIARLANPLLSVEPSDDAKRWAMDDLRGYSSYDNTKEMLTQQDVQEMLEDGDNPGEAAKRGYFFGKDGGLYKIEYRTEGTDNAKAEGQDA